MYQYTFTPPLTSEDFTYFSNRLPGQFGFAGNNYISLNARYIINKYLLTPEMERFMKYNTQENRCIEPELLYKFTFRGIDVLLYPNFVLSTCGAMVNSFKFFRGRTQYCKLSFVDFPAFDVSDLNNVVDASMYILAKFAPIKNRKWRDVDLDGLVYPEPLAAFFQPFRDTRGEIWPV